MYVLVEFSALLHRSMITSMYQYSILVMQRSDTYRVNLQLFV